MNAMIKISNVFFIVGFSCFLIFVVSCSDAQKIKTEAFIIEAGYVGSFHVIYNMHVEKRSGEKIKDANDTRVFEIPEKQVLLSPVKGETRWIKPRKMTFFYRSAEGLTAIKEHITTSLKASPEARADKTIRIFGGSYGEHESIYVACKLMTQSFYVGTNENVLEGTNFFEIVDYLKQNKVHCEK